MNDGYPTQAPYSRAGLLAKLTGAATLAVGAFLIGQGTSQPLTTGSALTYSAGVLQIAGSVPPTPTAGQTLIGGGAIKTGAGITVTAGTSAFQAVTATTLAASSTITATAASATSAVMVTCNNTQNGTYISLAIAGGTGVGIAGWTDAAILEAVGAAGKGNLVLGSYSAEILFQTNARVIAGRVPATGVLAWNYGITCTTLSAVSGSATGPSVTATGAGPSQGWYGFGTSNYGVRGGPDYGGVQILVNGAAELTVQSGGISVFTGAGIFGNTVLVSSERIRSTGGTAATSITAGATDFLAGGGAINCGAGARFGAAVTTVGAYITVAAVAASAANAAVFDFSGGGRVIATGANTTTRGSVKLIAASSDVSLFSTRFEANHTGVAFFGATAVAQATGFGAPTGAARLINFPGATATLAQCSGAIADMIAYLTSRGDFGA